MFNSRDTTYLDSPGISRRLQTRFFMLKVSIIVCVTLLLATISVAQNFTAVPLTQFQPGQLYLGAFPGFLYENSNSVPVDHDRDGQTFASQIEPLDAQGRPSPHGKIVAISVGFSNWTIEWCSATRSNCIPQSFVMQAAANPLVNHATLVLVNCAKGGESAERWVDNSFGNYTQCKEALQRQHVTEAQVQIILYKDGLEFPTRALNPTTRCSPVSLVDACQYEHYVGQTARFVKRQYPSLKQMFLHSRIYGGYAAPGTLNPEPYAYEYGFSTKWLIEAQIQQLRTGTIDATAGDLSYSAAPWLAWGPYLWAAGPMPRADGLKWTEPDYVADLTHPGTPGVQQVVTQLMSFYLQSPYSPWFRASGN
jgi:hypothetical protein